MEKEILNSMDILIADIIRNWVKRNYGESEADDPSWNIQALADELAKHSYDIWRKKEQEFVTEDVKMALEGWKNKLTDKEIAQVVDEYMYSDAYGEVDAETIQYFARRELELRKEKDGRTS